MDPEDLDPEDLNPEDLNPEDLTEQRELGVYACSIQTEVAEDVPDAVGIRSF